MTLCNKEFIHFLDDPRVVAYLQAKEANGKLLKEIKRYEKSKRLARDLRRLEEVYTTFFCKMHYCLRWNGMYRDGVFGNILDTLPFDNSSAHDTVKYSIWRLTKNRDTIGKIIHDEKYRLFLKGALFSKKRR